MFASVLLVCVFTKLLERSGGGDEEDKLNGGYQSRKKFLEEAYSKKDVVTEGGQLIHFTARTDLEVDHMLEKCSLYSFYFRNSIILAQYLMIPRNLEITTEKLDGGKGCLYLHPASP